MRSQRDDTYRPRKGSPPTSRRLATPRQPPACVATIAVVAWLLPMALGDGRITAQETQQDPPPQDHSTVHPEAREAISKLRSPFCPGLMLEVCPSLDAQALRDSLDAQARDGAPADSLVERMVAAYGEEYRAFPKRTGTGLLAWVVPPAGLLAGLGLVVVALKRLRGSAATGLDAEDEDGTDNRLTSEEEARLDAALAEFDAMEEAEA